MKKYLTAALLGALLAAPAADAAVRKPCTELRDEIAAKLDAKGVIGYSLAIVAPDAAGDAKIVGSCDGGTQRIVYQREAPNVLAQSDREARQ